MQTALVGVTTEAGDAVRRKLMHESRKVPDVTETEKAEVHEPHVNAEGRERSVTPSIGIWV